MPLSTRTGCCFNHDLNIVPQVSQAFQHFRFGDTAKLAAQHAGKFWLGDVQQFGSLHLGQLAPFDDVADLCCQLRNAEN
jgi:hypothetical protein